jgi:hypothetical protein
MAVGGVGARPAGYWELYSVLNSIYGDRSHAYQGFEDEMEGVSSPSIEMHTLTGRCHAEQSTTE